MNCPECGAELRQGAHLCPICGHRLPAGEPDPLDVVAEAPGIPAGAAASGAFAYGRQEVPGGTLRPTDWTSPMRLAVLTWLGLSALVDIFLAFSAEDSIRHAFFPAAQVDRGDISLTQGLGSAQAAFNVVLVLLALWLVIKAALAAGAYSGRTGWTFYAAMAMLAVYSLFGLVSLVVLATQVAGRHSVRLTLVALMVELPAAALLGWMVLGLRRFGPWASVRGTPEA